MKITIGIAMLMFMSSVFAKDYKVDDLVVYETDAQDLIKLTVFVGRLAENDNEYLIEFVGAPHNYHGQVFHYQKKSPSRVSTNVNYHLS